MLREKLCGFLKPELNWRYFTMEEVGFLIEILFFDTDLSRVHMLFYFKEKEET